MFFIPQPLIDCMTCYKTYLDVIQENPKPYIHCIHKPALTKVNITKRAKYIWSFLVHLVVYYHFLPLN